MKQAWMPLISISLVSVISMTINTGCTTAFKKSLGGDTRKLFSTIFLTDFETAYLSTLDSLKGLPLDTVNRETGFILTKWVDNTRSKNFSESFGSYKVYQSAQYRIRAQVSKNTYYDNSPATKVSIFKEQLARYDVLDGWIPQETDGIEENTLLYRVGRLIYLKTEIAKIEYDEEQRRLRQIEREQNKDKKTEDHFEQINPDIPPDELGTFEFEKRDDDKVTNRFGYETGAENFKSLNPDGSQKDIGQEDEGEPEPDDEEDDDEFEDATFIDD